MPKATLTEADFRASLNEVIRPDDGCVWLAAGIWTFAHRFGWPPAEIPRRLLDLILDAVGPQRTLILSSYTFSYARTRVYDIARTLPETGVLPVAALGHAAFRRTLKPINNYLVAGPRAAEVLALPCTTAWGEDGVMAWAETNDVRLCIVGVPWDEACSFYHRAEQVAAVPYRFYKRFPGLLMRNGTTVGPCEETMFVGSLSVRPAFNWRRIRPRIPQWGEVLRGSHPLIFVESAKASAVQGAGLSILEDDPYGLLTNADAVREWVSNDRDREIEQLPQSDRCASNR